MVVVVLGMHKSGTTLVSEILHKSGIDMVEDYDDNVGYYKGNKMERSATLEMNHRLIKSKDVSSLDIKVEPKTLVVSEEQVSEMKAVVENCQLKSKDWGFKDPRTCITYNHWKKVLPEHKLIFVYRHPSQVLNHYQKRSTVFNKFTRNFKSIQKWKANNLALLKLIEETSSPYIVINYGDLMVSDLVFQELSTFIGMRMFDARNSSISKNLNSTNNSWKFYDFLSKGSAQEIFDLLESFKAH